MKFDCRLFLIFFAGVMLGCDNSAPSQVERKIPVAQDHVEFSFSPVVNQFAPAVVNIYAVKEATKGTKDKPNSPLMDDPFFRQYMERSHNPEKTERVSSMGSGVIVRDDGYILTNYHVVSGGGTITVVLHDRREFEAKVVISEERTDLVMLKIDVNSEKLPTAALDNRDDLEVGDVVLAIGNPFGVGQSVSMGIISAVGRSQAGISDFRSFIQTDASINPGNSGGALVTTDGRLIGINTAIYSKSGESIGIGFAIPSSLVVPFVESALQGKKTIRPWLGVRVRTVGQRLATKLGFPYPYGVLIEDVFKGGAGDQAGIQVGDILTHFNETLLDDDAELDYNLSRQKLNTIVTMKLLRQGKEMSLDVKMLPPPEGMDSDAYEIRGEMPLTGAVVAELSPSLAIDAGLDPFNHGIVIVDIKEGSRAEKMNFKIGDVITAVSGGETATLNQFLTAVEKSPPQWKVDFLRNQEKLTFNEGTP